MSRWISLRVMVSVSELTISYDVDCSRRQHGTSPLSLGVDLGPFADVLIDAALYLARTGGQNPICGMLQRSPCSNELSSSDGIRRPGTPDSSS